MPDWQKTVSERLSDLRLQDCDRKDVIAELAAHLEERYHALCEAGLSEDDAARRALSEVRNWKKLERQIYSARRKDNTMNARVKCVWLPGLLTFFISMVLLEVAQKFGPQPMVLHLDHPPVLMFYARWLLILPLAGALGAYLSKLGGGSLRLTLLASIFPVLPFATVFLIAIPVGLSLAHAVPHTIVAAAFFEAMLGWVLAPAVALIAGGLLVQFASSRRSRSGLIAAN
jgi:hypothetical protein